MSRRGLLGLELPADAQAAAPQSGIVLGPGRSGPVTLRLFRRGGTRVVLAARVAPAQLLVVRAAAAGTPVQVVTSRPQLWRPLLPSDGGHLVTAEEARTVAAGGPTMVVDDRPPEVRQPAEVRPWQCRVDVRAQWTPAALASFAHADLTIFGAIPVEFAPVVARAYGLPVEATQVLARLDAGSFGLVRRRRLEIVSLNPTAPEGQVLARAQGAPAGLLR